MTQDQCQRAYGAQRRNSMAAIGRYNAIPALDFAEQGRFVAEELFGSAGVGASVQQGFNCDNGRNIHVGDHLIINYGCTILDVAEVTMGDWVMIGPHVLISTVNHPPLAARAPQPPGAGGSGTHRR